MVPPELRDRVSAMPFRCEKCHREWDGHLAIENELVCTRQCGGKLLPVSSQVGTALEGVPLCHLPYPLAMAAKRLAESARKREEPLKTLFRLKDCFEGTVRYIGAILLAGYVRREGRSPERDAQLLSKLVKPSVGTWVSLVADDLSTSLISRDTSSLVAQTAMIFVDLSQREEAKPTATLLSKRCSEFVRYRNDALGHGALRKDDVYERDVCEWLVLISDLLDAVAKLHEWQLCLVTDAKHYQAWMGPDFGFTNRPGSFAEQHVGHFVMLKGQGESPEHDVLDLYPFICLLPDADQNQRVHFYDSIYQYRGSRKEVMVLEYDNGFRQPSEVPVVGLEKAFGSELLSRAKSLQLGRISAISRRVVNFGDLIAAYADIVGRRAVIDYVSNFIADHDRGVLVIEGQPGKGKTAIIAHVTEVTFGHQFPPPVHFFYRRTAGVTDPDLCVRSLYAALLEAHGIVEAEGAQQEPNPDAMFNKLVTLLNDQVAPRLSPLRPQIILIDALDESATTATGKTAFQRLPESIPAGVYVIATTRPVGDRVSLTRRAHLHWYDLDAPELLADDLRDGAEYVRRELSATEIQAETVEEIAQVAAGNFLVLKLLCRHVRSTLEPSQVRDLLRRLATDGRNDKLGFIYSEFWQRITSRCTREDLNAICEAIGLLVTARAPSTADMICEALGWRAADWDFASRQLMEYLATFTEEEGPESETFHRLYHESFADFLKAKVAPDSGRFERILAQYCSNWSHMPDGYGRWYSLAHGPAHMHAARQRDDLYSVARDGRFLGLQAERLVREPDASLRTIRLALDMATSEDDPVPMAEFCLRHASRVMEIRRESPLLALRSGSLERATKLADLCPPEMAVLWYMLLAAELCDSGKTSEGRLVLDGLAKKALPRLAGEIAFLGAETLTHMSGVARDAFVSFSEGLLDEPSMVYLARRLVESRVFLHAVGITLRIPNAFWRSILLGEVAEAQAGIGDITSALDTTRMIDHFLRRNAALRKVVAKIAEGRRPDVAMKLATRIGHAATQQWAFRDIAVAWARRGDFASAFRTLKLITSNLPRAVALRGIAEVMAESGLRERSISTFAEASWTAVGIRDEHDQAKAFQDIALAEARAGYTEAALRTLQKIAPPDRAARVLASICLAHLGKRDPVSGRSALRESVDRLQQIEDESTRSNALKDIASWLSDAQEFALVREMIALIPQESNRDEELGRLAMGQLQAGDLEGAVATAKTIGQPPKRDKALINLAGTLARSEDFENALGAVQHIVLDEYRKEALREIAAAQAVAGERTAAMTTLAMGIGMPVPGREGKWVAQALVSIARALLRTSDTQGALAIAETLQERNWQGVVLAEIAVAQAERADVDASLLTAARIPTSGIRGKALKDIAEVLVGKGEFGHALEAVQRFSDLARQEDRGAPSKSGAAWPGTRFFMNIVSGYARKGDFPSALGSVERIPGAGSRDTAIVQIVAAMAEQGKSADALATVGRIGRTTAKMLALARVVGAQYRAGEKQQAEMTRGMLMTLAEYEAAPDTQESVEQRMAAARDEALRHIAGAMIEVGDVDEALQTISGIGCPSAKIFALARVACAQLSMGKQAQAEATRRMLGRLTETVADAAISDNVTRSLALAEAEAGKSDLAVGTAKRILQARVRVLTLSEVAVACRKQGDENTALDILRVATAEAHADSLTDTIAVCLGVDWIVGAKAVLPAAVDAISCIGIERRRSSALSAVAVLLAKSGLGREAVQTAEGILSRRDVHFPKIAEALLLAGDAESFKRVIEPCAYTLNGACRICGLLAQSYPGHAQALVEVVGTHFMG